jgi:succinate dehydrogenase/fumarate reductase flavoprotein subunit
MNQRIRTVTCNTVIVGTGAAGYNAADCLYQQGQKDIAIITEHKAAGTSRNTGSDKQTYYKLSLSGAGKDSVDDMAEDLYKGGCVDGDHALCEAALSVPCFMKLVQAGVPFPKSRYGEYIGYQTDHDQKKRATSAGPYTSKYMTECLEQMVIEKEIPIYSQMLVIRLLTESDSGGGRKIAGLLCLDLNAKVDINRFVVFGCQSILYATGGPAGIYADSVYPLGHHGGTGLAFEAGAAGKNLTEWQYGMASVKPRWNVSGTYMQVLPKFISMDFEGNDEREFLYDYFADKSSLYKNIFIKGYQWPFDIEKAREGSGVLDLLVYQETVIKKRKVFLDFRDNTTGGIHFEALGKEVFEYLNNADACFGTPVERLRKMNEPAYLFFKERGVDLTQDMLEIAVCAQHNNGGLAVDHWWQTCIKGLFAVGEAAGTHGIYRPGGSALNAGQVGALRAAEYIALHSLAEDFAMENIDKEPLTKGSMNKELMRYDMLMTDEVQQQIRECIRISELVITDNQSNVKTFYQQITSKMSRYGGVIRDFAGIQRMLLSVHAMLKEFAHIVRIKSPEELDQVYRLRDTLLTQYVYLSAMGDYLRQGGKSRGGALYTEPSGHLPIEGIPEVFRYETDQGRLNSMTQEIYYEPTGCTIRWRTVRPIPREEQVFETLWRQYRENKNID